MEFSVPVTQLAIALLSYTVERLAYLILLQQYLQWPRSRNIPVSRNRYIDKGTMKLYKHNEIGKQIHVLCH